MESSHLVIFLTSGKFIMKFNVLRCISLSETLFWTGARGQIPIALKCSGSLSDKCLWGDWYLGISVKFVIISKYFGYWCIVR